MSTPILKFAPLQSVSDASASTYNLPHAQKDYVLTRATQAFGPGRLFTLSNWELSSVVYATMEGEIDYNLCH